MTTQELLNIALNILGSIGTAGAIVLALSSWQILKLTATVKLMCFKIININHDQK